MLDYSQLSMTLLIILLAIGVFLLYMGGEWLCKGAEAVALIFDINPVIIGLTIVAVATSMPELVTSFYGAANGSEGIAIGNIVGSNIANLGLILGIGAMIAPVTVHVRLVRKEMPILMLVTAVFTYFCYTDSGLSAVEGMILCAGTVIYLFIVVKTARKEDPVVEEAFGIDVQQSTLSAGKACFFIVLGGLLLHFGAETLVKASVEIATRMGIEEVVIGLTIVAVGTSLPELAASIAAARRGQSDICIGNVIGSNLFNVLLIGGSVSAIFPISVDPRLLSWEFPLMAALTACVWFFIASQRRVTRTEGLVLVLLYIGIMTYTVIRSLG